MPGARAELLLSTTEHGCLQQTGVRMLDLTGTSEDADISSTHSPLNAQAVAQKVKEADVP